MKINLIAIGKNPPAWVMADSEYAERLPKNFQLHLIEIPTAKRSGNVDLNRIRQLEAERMLKAIPEGNLVIALDERGKQWRTLELAKQLQIWQEHGQDLSLLIGGPDGLAPSCQARANFCWSLSTLTLPHHLARIIVAEQIYRAWSILKKHPYHRE